MLFELFSIWRRYKFESNSQLISKKFLFFIVVFNMTKIQVRKQFTTDVDDNRQATVLFSIWRRYKFESNSQLSDCLPLPAMRCFQYDEDTSSKAIHNSFCKSRYSPTVVFNMTKIQVRKQFTTLRIIIGYKHMLFSIWRRYKFESNSQRCSWVLGARQVVFNMTKIQVRKQFTTIMHSSRDSGRLFSIWRRYKFESNSQQGR